MDIAGVRSLPNLGSWGTTYMGDACVRVVSASGMYATSGAWDAGG